MTQEDEDFLDSVVRVFRDKLAAEPPREIRHAAESGITSSTVIFPPGPLRPMEKPRKDDFSPEEIPEGACCDAEENCTITTEADCAGTYKGDDTECVEGQCAAPIGACCDADTNCTEITEAQCGEIEGAIFHADENCSPPTPCAGACCETDYTCFERSEADCGEIEGAIYYGGGTACADVPCSPPGACCVDGICTPDMMAEDCTDIGGEFQGEGSGCDPDPCVCEPGPCCYGEVCVYECSEDCNGIQADSCEDCVP